MLKNLVLIRIKSMFAGMFARSKKKISGGKIFLFALLGIYIIGCFGILFGGMFASVRDVFAQLGMPWLYFGLMGLMVFALCFVGSVFITQNQLYEAKDNDLLLSMPIPVKYILASRLLSIIILNYAYELLVIIPGAVVYCSKMPVTFIGCIFFLIAFLLLPLLVVAASALFGWLIALANTKMRNKNVIMMILTLILFLAYMYVCLRLQYYLQKLIENGSAIGEAIQKALPPFYYLGKSITDGDVVAFFIFLAFCIVPFALVYYILSRSFIKIATTNRGHKKIVYKEKAMKASGIRKALIIKESRHFLGSPMYIFNAGIGLLFMLIAAVYLCIKRGDMLKMAQMFPNADELIGPLICVGFGAMASLTIISAPMISIEAKTLWISQSLPVRGKDVLLAKADVHTLMSLPFIVASAVMLEFAYDMSIISRIMILFFPLAVTVFNAYTGIALNLKYPKFDWVNETDAVKQGVAPFLAMFIAAATVALPVLLYAFLFSDMVSAEIYLCIVFLLFVAASAVLYRYLTTRGVEIFKNLQN
ncbi:hypothetical protein [Emergencia sp.]|uniref:hypothetical protein n=1 Tax=Emergencia sp. TaxID=1926557 RepID=UPI003AEF3B7F